MRAGSADAPGPSVPRTGVSKAAERAVRAPLSGISEPAPLTTVTAQGMVAVGPIAGWSLRMVVLLAAALAVAVSAGGAVSLWSLVGMALAALVIGTAAAPGTLVPLLLLLAVVGLRLLSGGSRPDAALVVLVALLPLIHQLCGIAAVVPGRGRVPVAALVPAAGRYLVAVVPVEVATLLALLLG